MALKLVMIVIQINILLIKQKDSSLKKIQMPIHYTIVSSLVKKNIKTIIIKI